MSKEDHYPEYAVELKCHVTWSIYDYGDGYPASVTMLQPL